MSDLFYAGQARRTGGGFLNITMKDGAALAKKISKLEKGGETAVKRTVQDFTARAPAWVSKGIRQHYGVDTGAINEAGPKKRRGASHVKVAGITVDGATLEYKGRTLTPLHFGMSPKGAPTARQARPLRIPGQAIAGSPPVAMVRPPKKYRIKATILKGGRASMPPDSFIASGNGGATLPFQREGAARGPIEAIHTLSVPQMISGKAQDTIEDLLATNLQKRFEHHVEQAMK